MYIIVLYIDVYVYVYVYIDTDITLYIYTCVWANLTLLPSAEELGWLYVIMALMVCLGGTATAHSTTQVHIDMYI